MSITAKPPYKYFTEADGSALESGKIYVGVAGLDAEANPITAYWDSALTVAAVQPIRTIGGAPDNSGTPSDFFTAGDYSITVRDVSDVLVYSKLQLNANDLDFLSLFKVYDDVTDIEASTEDSRGTGAIWDAGIMRFEEAASGATDQHITTSGGVKLYEFGGKFTTFARFLEALARGSAYVSGAIVKAGPYTLAKVSGAVITDATGWSFTEKLGPRLPAEGFMAEAETRFNMLGDRESGNHNVLQNFVIDYVNRRIYTNQVTGSSPEFVYMNRYDLDGPLNQSSLDYQNNSSSLRHQSLALEYQTDGSIKLWSSSEIARENLVRFDYTALGAPANIENFQVGDSASDERVWNVSISPDQIYLVAQTGFTYRVYDFQVMLAAGAGDHSDTYLYEFTTDVGSQGFSCDGDYIYIWSGVTAIADVNDLVIYTLYGDKVLSITDNNLGEADAALEGAGTNNEPEGIAAWSDRSNSAIGLAVGLAQGDSGYFPGRVNKLYMPPVVSAPTVLYDEAETVLAAFSGSQTVAHRDAVHKLVGRLKTGGVWDNLGAFWVLAADTSGNALIDWIQPATNDLTLTGSPAFTAFSGYAGNGSDTLLGSTLDASAISSFASGDGHMAFYNTVGDAGGLVTDISIGQNQSDYLLRARSAGNKINVRFGNIVSDSPPGGVSITAARCVIASRDSSTNVNNSFDGRYIYAGVVTQTETFGPTGKVYLLGRLGVAVPFEVTSRTMGAASIGGALTRQEVSVYRNAIKEYLTNAGATP